MGSVWWLLLCIPLLSPTSAGGVIRVYYLGIHEVNWNYAPTGRNVLANQSIARNSQASAFLQSGKDRVGSTYKKAVYKQYTDSTYTTEIPKPAWLGFLGPVIRAEVGDTIQVHLKNFATRPYTVHPHGVFYKKDSEGSLYPDMSPQDQKKDDAVFPGRNYTYTWTVPEDHSPTDDDPNCLTWIYHSHIDAPRDIASGLIGPLLTCKTGTLTGSSQRRSDVDVDFFLMFSVVDENLSWYLDENIALFCTDPGSVDKEDEEFQESNKMHAINGRLYATLPGLTMHEGERVNWYLLGMGHEVDVHTVHFHAETFIYKNGKSYRADVVDLFPGTFEMVEMLVGNPGTWLLHCHVSDHIHAGMEILFTVLPRGESELEDITATPGLALEDEDGSQKVMLFGSKVTQGQIEATVISLAVVGVLLLVAAGVLLGAVIHLERQRRLRRNRRSILDDGFKLMSQKNSGL
uniref:ferroxidase n=1 Tax=Zonotrichia albicollis TaxID=44394 RepID=A0A8D2N822_ZONAL